MGVRMSKSDQNSSEISDSGVLYERVIENNDKETERTEDRKTHENNSSYENSDLKHNGLNTEIPKPLGQESEVLQMLCAADDEELDDGEWTDIYQRLKTDKSKDLHNAKTKFWASKDNKENRMKHAGPVFTSTVAERPTRINSANFSPHAVPNENELSRYQRVVAKNTGLPESDENIEESDQVCSNVTISESKSTELLSDDLQTSDGSEVTSENKLYYQTRDEIDKLLAMDTEPDGTPVKSSEDDKFLSVPSVSNDSTTKTEDPGSDTNIDQLEGPGFQRDRVNSIGNISVYSVKEISDELYREHFYEIRKCIRSHGFFEKFPTPSVVSDAQMTYRKLEIPTPADDDGNILPHPPKSTKQDVFATQAAACDIDIRILNAPEDLVQNSQTTEVVKYLCHDLDDNVSQIRAISTWLAVRQLQTDDKTPRSDTPERWCKTFRTMCRICRIRTKLIKGVIRGPKFLPGDDMEKHRGVWVAVLLNKTWWVVDPVLKKSISEDFAETANKNLSAPADGHASQSLFRYAEQFFSDPEHFIFTHYPDDEYWQLLARPVDREELAELAVLRHGYFTLDMKLVNQTKSIVTIDKEELRVSLTFPENKLRQFMCKLYLCGNTGLESEIVLQRGGGLSLRRFLFTETVLRKHLVNVKVRFPKKGSYILDVYGCSKSQPWQKVVTYKLMYANHIISSPFPLNVRDEWGPGADSYALGLTAVSHTDGEIVVERGITQIVFKDKKGLQFKQEILKDNVKVDSEQVKLSFLRDKDNEVVFVLDIDPALNGTYTLQLSARSDTSKPFNNVCNYLIKKVECSKASTSEKKLVVPRFEFTNKEEKKTIHTVPDTGRLILEVDIPGMSQVYVEFKLHDRQELNFSEHVRSWIDEDRGYVDLNFPRKGRYSVKIQARSIHDNRFKTIREEHFQADIPSEKWSCFPKVEGSWTSYYKIESPLNHHLEEKENETFTVNIKNVQDVAVLAASGWYHLEQIEEGIWRGQVWTGPRATRCKLLARFEIGSEKFSDLLWFKVMSEDDYDKMEDRQEMMREHAFKARRDQR